MRAYGNLHPAVTALHLLLIAASAMFCSDMLLLGTLLGGIFTYVLLEYRDACRHVHMFAWGMLLLIALLNPLWNQHGATPLVVINRHVVTLEALQYGIMAGLRTAAVLYACALFSQVMTKEHILYLMRHSTPKLALVCSMALRYLPLMRRRYAEIRQAQLAIGKISDETLIDRITGGLRVFSILLTWSLEHGIVTANSMEARGYGIGKRSVAQTYPFTCDDGMMLGGTLLCGGWLMGCLLTGVCDVTYYPLYAAAERNVWYYGAWAAAGLLSFLPILFDGKERYRWHCLRSNI